MSASGLASTVVRQLFYVCFGMLERSAILTSEVQKFTEESNYSDIEISFIFMQGLAVFELESLLTGPRQLSDMEVNKAGMCTKDRWQD